MPKIKEFEYVGHYTRHYVQGTEMADDEKDWWVVGRHEGKLIVFLSPSLGYSKTFSFRQAVSDFKRLKDRLRAVTANHVQRYLLPGDLPEELLSALRAQVALEEL